MTQGILLYSVVNIIKHYITTIGCAVYPSEMRLMREFSMKNIPFLITCILNLLRFNIIVLFKIRFKRAHTHTHIFLYLRIYLI